MVASPTINCALCPHHFIQPSSVLDASVMGQGSATVRSQLRRLVGGIAGKRLQMITHTYALHCFYLIIIIVLL